MRRLRTQGARSHSLPRCCNNSRASFHCTHGDHSPRHGQTASHFRTSPNTPNVEVSCHASRIATQHERARTSVLMATREMAFGYRAHAFGLMDGYSWFARLTPYRCNPQLRMLDVNAKCFCLWFFSGKENQSPPEIALYTGRLNWLQNYSDINGARSMSVTW